MKQGNNANQQVENWEGDVMSRHQSADFLYRLVMRKYSATGTSAQNGALCFAIDGDWGTGKSFFVSNWSNDVERYGHPVIRFDAWKNDLAEDPLVAFMAQLKSGLEPYLKAIPTKDRAQLGGKKLLAQLMRNAGHAVIPVSLAVGKSLAKNYLGPEIGKAFESVTGGESGDTDVSNSNRRTSLESAKIAEAALDKYFEVAMKSHSDRQKAIEQLKGTIEELLKYMENSGPTELPLFVFVDELDRCRPDYAILLLEGLKHLFDAKGVCFVVSTNLQQLSESVRSVYGAGFDGYRYLKRFFAFEFVLPEPDNLSFAKRLLSGSFLSTPELVFETALPQNDAKSSEAVAACFAWIAQAFDMDLRSQEQVFRHSEAAISGMSAREEVHCFYIFFLAALLHYNRAAFETLSISGTNLGFKALMDASVPHFKNLSLSYEVRENRTQATRSVDLEQLVNLYHGIAKKKMFESRKRFTNSDNETVYPTLIEYNLAFKEPHAQVARDLPTPIAKYYALVRNSGRIA